MSEKMALGKIESIEEMTIPIVDAEACTFPIDAVDMDRSFIQLLTSFQGIHLKFDDIEGNIAKSITVDYVLKNVMPLAKHVPFNIKAIIIQFEQ